MDPIWDYINDGTLPDDPKEAAKIRVRYSRFTNHKGSLYKRGFFTPFLKCIAGEDTEYVLREVQRHIWEPYRSSNLSRESFEAGILLAHNAQRCDQPGQKMQNLPGTY